MAENKQAPTAQAKSAGVSVHYKDTNYSLTRLRRDMIYLLSSGKKYSARQIQHILPVTQANSTIRDLRNMGINVEDVYTTHPETKRRYKLFWIDPKDCSNE